MTKMPVFTTEEILEEALEVIKAREIRYGEFDVTAYRTASLQSVIHEEHRTAEQWCLDMVATKLARIHQNPEWVDSYIDAICYLAEAAHLHLTKVER